MHETRALNQAPIAAQLVIRGAPELAVTSQELASITIPTLSIVGDQDPLASGARALRRAVPDCRYSEIRGADHVQVPMRAEFKRALRSFLDEASSEALGSASLRRAEADALDRRAGR